MIRLALLDTLTGPLRERQVYVIDLGRRKFMRLGALAVAELALVHVWGEPTPRWIAVERFDAAVEHERPEVGERTPSHFVRTNRAGGREVWA